MMNMIFIFNSALLLALPETVAAGPASADSSPTRLIIRGTVVDSTGAAILDAPVSVWTPAGERTSTTNAEGRFVFEGVPAGNVRISVAAPGFAPVQLAPRGDGKPLRIVLRPAGRAEQVTVRGSGVTVDRITSATRTSTPLRDVPQSVTVVTRTLMADQGMRGMADVLRFVPGVGVGQGEGNRDQPIFRGNSSTSDFFVDGIRDDVQYIRDVYNVERVEALKGPNAMTFGRGGVGGVINRVSRQADWSRTRELAVEGGAWNARRVTADVGQPIGGVAARVTALYENSDSYRDGVFLERYGVNPTFAFRLGADTTLRAGYERFHDDRTADRGISSFAGRPVAADPSQFFGNADLSRATVTVDSLAAQIEHRVGPSLVLRNNARYATYDKFYQNVFPGAVNAAGTHVSLSAYNNGTDRRNLFNQTDAEWSVRTGGMAHTILLGAEVGRQVTDNLRRTGYFPSLGPSVTTVSAPLAAPTTALAMDFRPSATDADNHGLATVASVYAQDQVALTRHVQALVGVRYDRFTMDFRNNRTAAELTSTDGVVSPRFGLVLKPSEPVSLYASYTRSFLPRAGEQLSSLSPTNRALEPEDFRNYEAGAKWDLASGLSLSGAVYRLERGNVAVADPVDPTVSHLVDGQRTRGVELGASGALTNSWTLVAGYAYQDGAITRSLSPTALEGARLAQVPEHSFSLWNRYELSRTWGVGLGVIHRGESFTSTDNTVVLPAFTRVDAAVFGTFGRFHGQVNLENLLDEDYFAYAHSNTNITPGSPRAIRVGLSARF
jgi:catecholate siderophore receptor